MAGWIDETMADLRLILGKLDQIAARLESVRTARELRPAAPVWSCGHEHATRGEAVACRDGAPVEVLVHEGRIG